jgi:hypothetical protein
MKEKRVAVLPVMNRSKTTTSLAIVNRTSSAASKALEPAHTPTPPSIVRGGALGTGFSSQVELASTRTSSPHRSLLPPHVSHNASEESADSEPSQLPSCPAGFRRTGGHRQTWPHHHPSPTTHPFAMLMAVLLHAQVQPPHSASHGATSSCGASSPHPVATSRSAAALRSAAIYPTQPTWPMTNVHAAESAWHSAHAPLRAPHTCTLVRAARLCVLRICPCLTRRLLQRRRAAVYTPAMRPCTHARWSTAPGHVANAAIRWYWWMLQMPWMLVTNAHTNGLSHSLRTHGWGNRWRRSVP